MEKTKEERISIKEGRIESIREILFAIANDSYVSDTDRINAIKELIAIEKYYE